MKYSFFFFSVCLGILIGIAIHQYTNIPLEETINIVDVATLIMTVFLAIYVPEVLDRKLQSRRDKKVLIENRIEEFQLLRRKINALVQDDSAMNEKHYLTIKNEIDVSLHKFDTIATFITYANFGMSFDADIAGITTLCHAHKQLLLIDTTAPHGTFAYSDDIRQREETLFNDIDKATGLLLFRIGDAE